MTDTATPADNQSGKKVSLTRKARFYAAHYFELPELSPEENRARFGENANINAHGHNYRLLVTVSGPVDPGWAGGV